MRLLFLIEMFFHQDGKRYVVIVSQNDLKVILIILLIRKKGILKRMGKIKWEKPTLVELGSVFTDGIVVVANCYYGDNTDKPDSDCHNGMGAFTEWGKMVR